eukprot:5258511-Prymnesium_polylepis.1
MHHGRCNSRCRGPAPRHINRDDEPTQSHAIIRRPAGIGHRDCPQQNPRHPVQLASCPFFGQTTREQSPRPGQGAVGRHPRLPHGARSLKTKQARGHSLVEAREPRRGHHRSPQGEGPPNIAEELGAAALPDLAHLVRAELQRLRDRRQRVVQVALLHVAHEHVLEEGQVERRLRAAQRRLHLGQLVAARRVGSTRRVSWVGVARKLGRRGA